MNKKGELDKDTVLEMLLYGGLAIVAIFILYLLRNQIWKLLTPILGQGPA